jgi:hypothetical protein
MTHRYNTRFQAKKYMVQNERSVPKAQTPVKEAQTNEISKELSMLHTMLNEVNVAYCPFKKTIIATRIFHYIEYNQHTIKEIQSFRDVARRKANEFIEVANERMSKMALLYPTSDMYTSNYYLVTATNELKESCERVISIIDTM